MNRRFKKHYTREEANALLPDIRQWLQKLNHSQHELGRQEKRLGGMMASGDDVGGELVNRWVNSMAEIKHVLSEFLEREILIKDAERGLVDFPSIIGGKEVFLCWEQDEKSVEFWHDLDSGYAGRERL
jgi:hypothetical protein